MAETERRPRNDVKRTRQRGRSAGPTANDKKRQQFKNLAAIFRVYEAAHLQGYPHHEFGSDVLRRIYMDPVRFHERMMLYMYGVRR
jgi:hypothetical protein